MSVGSTTTTSAATALTTSFDSANGATATVAGLGSGLDINSIITQLMTVESARQTALKTDVTKHQQSIGQYQALNTQFSAIGTAAQALKSGFNWKVFAATSSDPTAVTATATSAAISGTVSFVVKNLASAQTLASFGTVSSTSTILGSGNLLIGSGGSLGFAGLSGNLSVGAHTFAVTQSSAGATIKGAAVANSVTLNGTETLSVNVDGTAKSLTLQAGTYTQQGLAAMVSQVSGGTINATVNSDKSLQMTSTHEGSVASLQITGGTGLAALGLSAGAVTHGTNGIVTVDGTATTVSDVKPDGSNNVALNGGVTASFSGGLRVGTATITSVSTGTGSLSDVVNNINAANVGISAAAVQVAPNQYKMQIQSSTTGTAGAVSMDLSAFSGTIGQIQTITAAQDAQLQVGGTNGYTVTSSSNTVTGMLPGVTLNLTSADPNTPINITVAGDSAGLATKVKAMVDAANAAFTYIKANSVYDPTQKSAGSLLGNTTAEHLQSLLYTAMSDLVGGSSQGGPSTVGITSNDDGTFSFDSSVFATAYQANPEAVASIFVQGGSTSISDHTKPGIAERLYSVANSATDAVSGFITTAITGENATIKDLNARIAAWTTQLQAKQLQLQTEFDAMDSAVAAFKSQSSWLTSTVAGLAANK